MKYGVAMDNAQESIKHAAHITQSNNEEGVLNAIDSILKCENPLSEKDILTAEVLNDD